MFQKKLNKKTKKKARGFQSSAQFLLRKLLAISWEQKMLTHMQKIHKNEMGGYIFFLVKGVGGGPAFWKFICFKSFL